MLRFPFTKFVTNKITLPLYYFSEKKTKSPSYRTIHARIIFFLRFFPGAKCSNLSTIKSIYNVLFKSNGQSRLNILRGIY